MATRGLSRNEKPIIVGFSTSRGIKLYLICPPSTVFIISMTESTEVINEVINMDLTLLVNELRSFSFEKEWFEFKENWLQPA